jgi:mobilization protein NikA
MTKAPRKHAAAGRRRVENPKQAFIAVRCTAQERATIKESAAKSGLAVGAYLRATALGSPGPRAVRRPPVERKELARLLGHLGKVGSNINQLAYAFNSTRRIPGLAELEAVRKQIGEMRDALMKALGRSGHSGDY